MKRETVAVSMTLVWIRPKGSNGDYSWGDAKRSVDDLGWNKRNVIYRWVKDSTKEVAIVGETERTLSQRVDNYTSASPDSSAGKTNKKVYTEQVRLQKANDGLYLEYVDSVPGYDLAERRERRWAEALITGYARPYLQ